MSNTRIKKVLRDVAARKMRTLLVSLSIFVGVLGVVVLTTMGELITRQLEKDLRPGEMAMLRIYLNLPLGEQVDNAAVLDLLRQQPGVTDVEGQAVYNVMWLLPGQQELQNGHLYAYSEPFPQINLEPIRLLEGRYPAPGQHEIAIEKRMAERHGLRLGDMLTVRVNRVGLERYRIVGLVFQPYIYIGGNQGEAAAYAAYPDAERIIGFSGYSSIYVRFTDFATARQQSPAFRRVLDRQTPYDIVFYLLDDPDQNAFIVGLHQINRVLLIIAIVAIIVAGFLVTNVISTIVTEERPQMGSLKAIGATRADILFIYLGIAFIYGLLGTIPGVLIGIPLGQEAAKAAAPLANTILEDTTPPLKSVLLGIGLGLIVPVIAASVPVFHASRITILEALSDLGIRADYGRGLLPRLIKRLALPLPLHQAINNIIHHKARLALTGLTLTLAAAAFMGMFIVFYILNNVIDDIRDRLNYRPSTTLSSAEVRDLMQSLLTDDVVREIQPGIAIELTAGQAPEDEAGSAEAETTGNGEPFKLFVTGINTEMALSNLVLQQGTGWTDDPNRRGVVLTSGLAEHLGKSVGDTIHLQGPNRAADFEIIGIADYPLETAFMEWHQLADFVGTIRHAPTPNTYWEQVELQDGDGIADNNHTLWAIGIDERVGEYLVPGYDPAQPGVIITQALASTYGLKEGDTITLAASDKSLVENVIAPQARTYPIIRIVELTPQERALFMQNAPQELRDKDEADLIAMQWSELASLVQLDYQAITPQTFSINLENPSESRFAFIKPTSVYTNEVSFADRIAQTIYGIGVLMSFASLLMAMVGGIGLLTITSIRVFESQREIGVMRSVGATSFIIMRQFLLEGLVIGLLAWIAGLPISYFLSWVLIHTVPFNEVITYKYTPLAAVLGFIGILLLTIGATLYPALTAARKTVSEILRYQ